jgi:hypothetical protein
VISGAFVCVIASSGTWRLFCSGFLVTLGGCRHLDGFGAGWRLWEEKEIVLAHLPVICEGFLCFSR